MKRILKHLVGCIMGCIGAALVLVGEKAKRAFTILTKALTMPIVSKTVTVPIINYNLTRARSAALVNKTVTINAFCNQLIGGDGVFPSTSRTVTLVYR